jgi:hypothetical protein
MSTQNSVVAVYRSHTKAKDILETTHSVSFSTHGSEALAATAV